MIWREWRKERGGLGILDLDGVFLGGGLDIGVLDWAGMDCVLDCLLTVLFQTPSAMATTKTPKGKATAKSASFILLVHHSL